MNLITLTDGDCQNTVTGDDDALQAILDRLYGGEAVAEVVATPPAVAVSNG